MIFRKSADAGPKHKALLWGGGVTLALGLAVAVAAFGYSEQGSDDTVRDKHVAEQPDNNSLDSISGEADPHAHHRRMMESSSYSRSVHDYQLPDVEVVTMAGEKTRLLDEVNPGKPVMVNFVFTTCTTICPIMIATFAQVQSELGDDSDAVRMISFSIDPEYDTPERLREYAGRFNAGPQWQFLTGSLENSVAIQKALDVYRGNKMNHEPTYLMKAADSDTWVRIDGLAKAAEIVAEYHRLVGQ